MRRRDSHGQNVCKSPVETSGSAQPQQTPGSVLCSRHTTGISAARNSSASSPGPERQNTAGSQRLRSRRVASCTRARSAPPGSRSVMHKASRTGDVALNTGFGQPFAWNRRTINLSAAGSQTSHTNPKRQRGSALSLPRWRFGLVSPAAACSIY